MTATNPGLYNFTGQTAPDQTAQAGMQQYLAQGQQGINPGQAQVAASNPIAAAGRAGLAQAFNQPSSMPMPQQPSVGPSAPMGNLPVAPGMYQSQQALENAQGPLYPSPYAAQQSKPWLSRMADALMNSGDGS